MSSISRLQEIFAKAEEVVPEFPLEKQLSYGAFASILAILLFVVGYNISNNKKSSSVVQFLKFLPIALLASAFTGMAIVFISNSVSVYL